MVYTGYKPTVAMHAYAITDMLLSGHSLETFPNEMAAVRDAGHEMLAIFLCFGTTLNETSILEGFMGIRMRSDI